jgi:(p)ppGpp synthase/HD superfamily hydrolase
MYDSFSHVVDSAFIVASLAHRNQTRKGSRIPYIMHPCHVAFLLHRHGCAETVVVAGLLHDVLEDMEFGNHTLQEEFAVTFPSATLPESCDPWVFRDAFIAFLDRTFGAEVLRLVHAVTEPKNDGGPVRSWYERKQHQIDHLRRHVDRDVAALKAADTLHNVRSILRELDVSNGLDAMRKFKAEPRHAAKYYLTVAEIVSEQLGDHPLGREVLAAARELDARVASFVRP